MPGKGTVGLPSEEALGVGRVSFAPAPLSAPERTLEAAGEGGVYASFAAVKAELRGRLQAHNAVVEGCGLSCRVPWIPRNGGSGERRYRDRFRFPPALRGQSRRVDSAGTCAEERAVGQRGVGGGTLYLLR
jgi:hypothetical protein